MKNYYSYKINKNCILIVENSGSIVEIALADKKIDGNEKETGVIKKAAMQLCEYFAGKRRSFDFPINPKGSEFQKLVWAALQNIPYGKLCTYKQIAEEIGNAKASRAVGMANNKNPLPIVVPCHRVIGSNGKLTGYAYGLDMKEYLINIEKDACLSQK
ncbi:MAG: methylated-DNA--[protein]-cysteine S-methyltransferase [Prevotellaceae bacterium]|jgi:methylated-DNA-[protein]-cysteine S-methyltransferase|nr:methylated-DNA--[protein]-cysteine S-methyltransferase [Prevotellaceae bacterium]